MTATTMRAAVLYDVDDIRIEERAVPELGDGEILVRTQASGICSGDVMDWYIRRKAPLVLGTRAVGHRGIGPRRDRLRGRATASSCTITRRVSNAAPANAKISCSARPGAASRIEPGGIAEYFRVPPAISATRCAFRTAVPFEDAALTEPLACVVKSLRRGGVKRGDRVYIIGLGVMGQLHVLAARDMGANVVGSDFVEYRRDLAQRNGATAIHPDDASKVLGDGADVVICGPGAATVLQAACAAAAGGGSVVMFTPFPPEMPITLDATRFYFGDLRLTASYSCGPQRHTRSVAL